MVLQNCHLAASWMANLAATVAAITPENTDSAFRLWLTSLPSPVVPPTVLEASVKIATEPPVGVQANMLRSFSSFPMNDEAFLEGSSQPPVFKKLLFSLCFFHALAQVGRNSTNSDLTGFGVTWLLEHPGLSSLVLLLLVQERRSFGPIGWNIPYTFDDGDLRISARQLLMYTSLGSDADAVPFPALRYTIGECNYGGRVTDSNDRRLLEALLNRVLCPGALEAGFQLSDTSEHLVPEDTGLAGYLEVIRAWTDGEGPEVFGLHSNAGMARAQQQVLPPLAMSQAGASTLSVRLMYAEHADRCEKAKSVQADDLLSGIAAVSSSSRTAASSFESSASQVASALHEQLPALFNLEQASAKYPVLYTESLNQVLVQEMARYNKLLQVVATSLIRVQRAVAGLEAMSGAVEDVARYAQAKAHQ